MNVTAEGTVSLSNTKHVPRAYITSDTRLLRKGDVLFNNTNSPELVGKTAHFDLNGEFAFSNHMTRLRCRGAALLPAYCSLALHRKWHEGYFLRICNNHVSQASISRSVLADAEIPLPPLPEQRRIVERVEALLARVNEARARLARAPALLKAFRQAVLAAACAGKLTAEWRESRTPDRDRDDVPSGWRIATVSEVASREPRSIQSGPFGSNLLHSEFQTTGVLAIGIDNVLDGSFSLGRKHRISHAKSAELSKYRARPGDVLITVMATVGRVCVVPDDLEPAIITKHVYRITPDRTQVEPRYLMFSLMGDPGLTEDIAEQVRGQTRPGINGVILKGLQIRVSPLDEQREIVRRVDALFALADAIEAKVAVAQKRAEALTQGILAKAFRGELVSTEAALARAEGRSYESAKEFLERVLTKKAQGRATNSGHPPRRRRNSRLHQSGGGS